MTQEAFCSVHGPYDAHLGTCPFCQQEGRGGSLEDANEEETRVYRGSGKVPDEVDELETNIGIRRSTSGRSSAPLDEEETIIHGRWRRGRDDDEDPLDMTMIDHAVQGMLGWLIVKKGDRRGKIFTLKKETTIGRKGVTIALNDPKVSTLHAKVAQVDDHFVLADVLSTNGTYVNGERIKEQVVLEENDEVKIGDTLMVLKVLAEEES